MKSRPHVALAFLGLMLSVPLLAGAEAGQDGIRGAPEAVAAAQRLLEAVGGASAWRKPLFEVHERAYLASGTAIELHIVRDLARTARRLESRTPSRTAIEWISADGGWTRRDGEKSIMPAVSLAAEIQGLRQEPYAIYHRFAVGDPLLRVELRAQGALHVYDGEERLLCWFQIAPDGTPLGWGNFYDGSINQHWYGPLADMGDANLPRFGVSSTGSLRFEYQNATLTEGTLATPE